MNAKERFYSGLAKETIGKITSNTDNWTSFLRTMSRNYEFTYPEQVMIYAQRPNATFCKPYEDWNAENYRRYVKRGSTGIALFVMNRDKPYLRYVFDVADTGVRRSSPELKPWEVTPENRSYVMEAMEHTFGVAADGVLEAQLEDIASALAAEYWDDYKKQFLDIVANSFLEEYDELNIEVAFKNAVANSVSYTMYCRFVESPDNYFEHEDFQKVFDFNTRQTVNALGTAVNAISTRMFQEIEKAIGEHEQIKATERSTDYERDDLQTGRRLSDSEPSVGERGRETSGQVRQDASSIFGTEQSDAPERHDSDGEPVPAPVGDRGNSESQSGVSDGAVPEGQPRTGQGNAADGVGAAHEQPESTGGGSRDDGAYQQLSLNLFLSENEQISFIDRAESFTPSAFSFAQEEIDHFLLLGSNTDEARKVVALEYMKQKPLEEIVQTLKQVYHGGYGLKEDSGNICAWYAEDGIHLAKGSSAIDSPRGLNFVGNAVYHPAQDGKSNVAQFELIPWLLGSCATLAEVRTLLAKTNIVNIPFSEQLPLAQLHWLIADKTGSIVVESTADGLHIYDNPVGVLTNNPPFPQQLFALNNYRALSPRTPAVAFADGLDLPVYSRGLGALGLPGDLSSQSRFVRAAFVRMNAKSGSSEAESVGQFFHILHAVEQQRGCCELDGGKYEITLYTSCCNADRGIYYYTTYGNHQITAVDMHRENLDGDRLVRYPLVQGEQIALQN